MSNLVQPSPTPVPSAIPTVGVSPVPCTSCSGNSSTGNAFIGAVILLVLIVVLVRSQFQGDDEEFRIRVRKRR